MSSPRRPVARLLFLDDPQTDRRIKNFLGFFVASGFDVEFLFAVPGTTGPGSQVHFQCDGVSSTQLILSHASGPSMFLEFDKLLRQMMARQGPCDLLFAGDLYALNAAASFKPVGRVRTLLYDARELYTELPNVSASPVKKWFWKRWERRGMKLTDVLIVTAPDDAEAIRRVHGFIPETIVIRNFPEKCDIKENQQLREKFGIPESKRILVYVGGLQRERGLEKMIDAMSDLKDDAAFVIIGKDELGGALHTKVAALGLQKSVFFHEPINSGKVIEVLSSADIGISLIEQRSKSYQLALPSKVFEYLQAGLPVVSSHLKQVSDLLSKHEGVEFADPDNLEDVVAACRRAMAFSSDLTNKVRIRDSALKNFTFENETEKLVPIVRKFIEDPR